MKEIERLRKLPHLTKKEANRLAHAKAWTFYHQERERLFSSGFGLTAP